MKAVCKKLFCLMLVAMLLVSAVPAAFAADTDIVVRVRVDLDGATINDGKSITLTEGETVTLDEALAKTLIKTWDGREYVGWSSTNSGNATRISYGWAAEHVDDNYRLIINLKSAACNHTWGGWEQTKAPTCTEKGTEARGCEHCDATETREINASGHTWGSWSVTQAATCTVDGVKTRACTVCGATETDVVPAIGHDWDTEHPVITEEPDSTEKGKGYLVCKNDSSHHKEVDIDPTGVKLDVWANFYIDGEYHHREYLYTKTFDVSKKNTMFTWLYSDEGMSQTSNAVFGGGANSGYQWTPKIYYNYFGGSSITQADMATNGDKSVYIKVYSQKDIEASVMLYVHLKESETVDRVIPMPGYTAGDYVSREDAWNAVKTKYSGSKMEMSNLYTEESWDQLMDGLKPSGARSVKVEDNGITKIHVVLKNATSSSSSKADSSNPKTGDYIMIAVSTMALTGAALITMAELKKRKMI